MATYTVAPGPDFDLQYVHGGNCRIVVDRESGIYGSGATALNALRDFSQAVREHREVLESQPQLSEGLARQLAYLRERMPDA